MITWWATLQATLLPWKEVIGSALSALAAMAAVIGGILKMRRRPDATFTDEPLPAAAGRPGTFRLHADDRDEISSLRSCVGDLRESLDDLARETRRNTKSVEDNTEALGDNTGALNRRRGGRP